MGTGTGPPVGAGASQAYAGGAGYGVGGGQGTGAPTGFEGVASPYHHHVSNAGGAQGGSRLVGVALRAIAALLALVCLSVVAAAREDIYLLDADGNTFLTPFSALYLRPYKFLFAAAIIVLVYELVQIVLIFVLTNAMASHTGSLVTFVSDQLLAYLMFAAAASTVTQAVEYRSGDNNFIQVKICEYYSITSVCSKAEAGAAMAFLTCAILAVVAFISCRSFASAHSS